MKLLKLFESFKIHEELNAKFLRGELDDKFKKAIKNLPDFYPKTSPSKEFEQEYGITGVSKDWNNPYPLTWEELESFVYLTTPQITEKIFDDLIRVNPELKQLKPIANSHQSKYSIALIIGGVCSSFNLGDIKDYLQREHLIYKFPHQANGNYIIKKNGKIDKEYSHKYTFLYKKGYLIGWVPSIETLDYILAEVEKKENP